MRPTLNAATEQAKLDYFEKTIRPLFAKHCYECHSQKTGADNGELVLENTTGIRAGGTRGPLWQEANPQTSLLMEALEYRDPDLQMPPAGKLKPRELEAVALWIKQGAVLPKDTVPLPARKTQIDYETARRFWSFRPLETPTPPAVKNAQWPRGPLDRFVLHRLEAAKLSPQEEASREVLIRRLSFDLIGLPPHPEEVAKFVNDPSPDAYERAVDRLLQSPHYGERWARVWLDLARYTDTTASWLKSTGEAWRYRDWVIGAFNRNLPFDEFTRLQLAADLLEDTLPEDLAALGFLGLSPTYWKELKLAPEVIKEVVAEEWDERIDAVSRTFLGLTVACARCHDHKFDPLTSRDYYALAGVFASTQLDDRPLLPDEEAAHVRQAVEQVASLEAQLKPLKDKSSAKAKDLQAKIENIKSSTPHFDAPWVNVVKDASIFVKPKGSDATQLEYQPNQPRDLPVFRRGNPNNPGDVVPRGFPLLFSNSENPVTFQQGSGRLELAEALLTDAQALTARVFVNRIWAEHFGQGLVRTPSNFGNQGERPTHPELLEWLASEFVRRGWDIKWLHREIVLSAAYRQSSGYDETAHGHDPENRLLWRMNRRRLSVEMWRDAMLAVAGNLETPIGGPAVPLDTASNHRRTIYAKVARRELDPLLRMFDFPEPTAHSPKRVPTTTPLQQLFVLNGPFLKTQAATLAAQISAESSPRKQITLCYQRLFARQPNSHEIQLGLAYLGTMETGTSPTIAARRWEMYLHALLGLNEFLYID